MLLFYSCKLTNKFRQLLFIYPLDVKWTLLETEAYDHIPEGFVSKKNGRDNRVFLY